MQPHKMSYFKKIFIFMLSSILLLSVAASFIFPVKTLDMYFGYVEEPYDRITVEYKTEGIAETLLAESENEQVHVRFSGIKKGTVNVDIICYRYTDDGAPLRDSYSTNLTVTGSGFIYSDFHYNFNDYQYLFFFITISYIAFGIFMLHLFKKSRKEAFFSYNSILSLGLMLYYMLQGLALIPFSLKALISPEKMSGIYFFTFNSFVLTAISILSSPFLLIFSLLISISNIKLIKKEGKRVTNLLGIILSFLLVTGLIVIILIFMKSFSSYLDPTPKDVAINITRGVISSVFVYFECNLLATFFLAIRAGRHKPEFNKDYIIILGCGIRPDGTLYPLLRGRVDRAIAFYREQLEKTGKKAVFVPSGGQGPDEIISEGEAMKRYLIEQGIPEEQILPETRSQNTLQNMQYSKDIIESQNPDAKIVFSTTNYHVYRGGMLASSVGMNADGMGAKTKWYFWPNALIRELVGMLVKEMKVHIFLLIIIVTHAVLIGNIQLILNNI